MNDVRRFSLQLKPSNCQLVSNYTTNFYFLVGDTVQFHLHFLSSFQVHAKSFVWKYCVMQPFNEFRAFKNQFPQLQIEYGVSNIFSMAYWQNKLCNLSFVCTTNLFLKNRTCLTLWKVSNLKKSQNIAIFSCYEVICQQDRYLHCWAQS